MRVEREITLPAAPDEVYEVVMDPQRLADWVSIHEELKDAPSGLLEQDSHLHQRLKLAGRGFDVRWKVTTAERPEYVVWTGEGPARSTAYVEYHLSPDDAGTRFGYVNEFNLPGGFLGRFAGRAVAGTSIPDREADRSLERLRGLFGG